MVMLSFAVAPPPICSAACSSATDRWRTLPEASPLPKLDASGYVDRGDVRIWHGEVGTGAPVILLHGGMASSDSWGNQVGPLVASGRKVILIDSRGHGRSTLGQGALHYEVMAGDVVAVMNYLHLARADIVGWSDGANLGLILALKHPDRVRRVYAFGANMRTDALNPGAFKAPILSKAAVRLAQDYHRISPTPDGFARLKQVLETMQTSEPNYSTNALNSISGPTIAIVDGDHEEFISHSHVEWLAHNIRGARLIWLPRSSHFAPWQAPQAFNTSVLNFLNAP
jgi:pimeloyl-ACP methyl ester carboxylesterase